MGTMTPAPQDTTPWEHLGERLAGSFAARARGLLAPELLLSSSGGEEFGRLRLDGTEGACFEAGAARATIERGTASRHRMLDGGGKVLVEETAGPADAPEVRCGGRLYEARLRLLRNSAVARSTGGSEAARVAGGLTNRGYQVSFDAEDENSLPLAVFLLFRIVALRSRAFLTGGVGDADAGR
jgi:hypothetical protein